MNLKTRLPIVTVGDTTLTILVGTPEVEVGAEVTLRDLSTMEAHRGLVVKDVMVYSIIDMPDDILTTLGHQNFGSLRAMMTERFNVGIPAEARVTIVALSDGSTSLAYEDKEVVDMSDDDILPLVLDLPEEEEEEEEDVLYEEEELDSSDES